MATSPDFVGGVVAAVKRAVVRRVIGVIVFVVVGGVFAGINWAKDRVAPAKPAPVAQAARKPAAAKTAPAAQPPAAPVARSGETAPPAANTAPGARNAFAAAGGATGGPVVMPATRATTPVAGSTLAHLDDHLTYQYNALGRRDPFQSLVEGGFVAADQGGDAPPDIGGAKVVGIVWGASDQFALAEDARGNSFVLRKGDKIQNGYVEGLKRDGVIVNITTDGQSQTVIIPLTKKGEQK